MYRRNWCDRCDAKQSTLGVPIISVVLENFWGHNLHLLESVVWRDSTWTFWEFGRYSAVSVILFSIKHSQISLDTLPSYVLFGPPIFTMFLPCRLTDFGFFILQSNSIAYLPAFISKTLCGIVPSPCSTDFLPSVPGRVLPNHLILLHPAEL